MSSSLPRIKSEPSLQTNSLHPSSSNKQEFQRRKSTLPNASDYYDPRMVLQLILSQPHHAYIGIGPNLRPLIELTINDLNDQDEDDIGGELIDEALLRLEIEEFKSFVPLKASIQNFETILDQKYTYSLIYAVCHALIGSFLSGYNTSLLNIPSIIISKQCNLSLNSFSLLQSMYCVGGLFGCLFAGYIADKYGRKITLLFANCLFMFSGIVSLLYCFEIFGNLREPITFKYFIISRVISGLASGISTAVVPTYLGEISPAIIRGEIGTLNAFINAFGILFAEIVGFNYLFGTETKWKYIFVINIIPFIMQLFFINSLCESPQWLLVENINEKAREIFIWLRETENVEIDMRSIKTNRYFSHCQTQSQTQQQSKIMSPKNNNNNNNKIINSKSSLLNDVVGAGSEYGTVIKKSTIADNSNSNKTVLIYIFFITILLQILQQFSGINSVWYYSSFILQHAGLTSFELWIGNILIASSNFFGVLIPVKLIEKLGRKLLIYLSCLGMVFASVMLSLVLMFTKNKSISDSASGLLCIIILILYVISFAVGLGPIVGLLTVELSPSKHRGSIVSVAFFINYCANLFVAQYANIIIEYLYYLPFAAICLAGCVFNYSCLIETKGKKENDIQEQLLFKLTGKTNDVFLNSF